GLWSWGARSPRSGDRAGDPLWAWYGAQARARSGSAGLGPGGGVGAVLVGQGVEPVHELGLAALEAPGLDELADFVAGVLGLVVEAPELATHDPEGATVLTGLRGDDVAVEREQLEAPGDVVDEVDDRLHPVGSLLDVGDLILDAAACGRGEQIGVGLFVLQGFDHPDRGVVRAARGVERAADREVLAIAVLDGALVDLAAAQDSVDEVAVGKLVELWRGPGVEHGGDGDAAVASVDREAKPGRLGHASEELAVLGHRPLAHEDLVVRA